MHATCNLHCPLVRIILHITNLARNYSMQSDLLLTVCVQSEHPADLVVAGLLQKCSELFAVSLFRMLTQLPERRRLSCGTMWPDRTHSSSLTFLCACSLGRELFMLHCFHRKQCHFNSRLLGDRDLFSVTVL